MPPIPPSFLAPPSSRVSRPAPGTVVVRPPRTPKPQLTPQQWAEAQVAKLIAAQVASIQEQRKVYLDELMKRSQLEAERGQALANALRGMDFPGRMSSIYGGAAHDISGLAGGFSQAMQGVAAADAAQQAHMLSGTGQEGAVRNEGVGMGDVIYGSQGYIPGRAMSETGAAFAQQAALEPAFAAQIGLLNAGKVHAEGLSGLSDFTKALIEARSQRPELVQQFLEKRQSMISDAQKQKLAERDAQREWYLKLAALEMSRGNQARADAYLKLAGQRENRMAAGQTARETRQRNKDMGFDANGNLLPGYHVNTKTGRVEKIPTPKAGAKGSTSSKVPGTPAYRANALQMVGKARANIDADVKAMIQPADLTKPGTNLGDTVKPSYRDAYNKLWRKYSYLATTAEAKKALKASIIDALTYAGIVKVKPAPVGSSPGHL